MAERKGKIMSLNICSFGINHIGVPLAAVIAQMCPFVNIAVVDMDPEKVTSWNTKQINMREAVLEDILKKCQNRNLVFTADMEKAINVAEVIFLCTPALPSLRLGDEGCNIDLTETEKAVRFIASNSESSKIVVINSVTPMGTSEKVKRILLANKRNNVKFEVLSIPTFLSPGDAVTCLLNPDRVLIGYDSTKEGLEAVGILEGMYSQWVPLSRILPMKNRSAELSVLFLNAFLAQNLSSLNSLCAICEEYCGDISEVGKVVAEFCGISRDYFQPSFAFGGSHLKNGLNTLIYMFERLNLNELAEYWRNVLVMNEYLKKRFTKKIISTFYNILNCEKISVWGIAYKKNAEYLEESPGAELCLNLLKDKAKLTIYDAMEKRLAVEEFMAYAKKCGFDKPLLKDVVYYDDPYKAVQKADAIVVCNELEEYKNINFNDIYKEMVKPPYIFDGRKCLPHEELKKIGFLIQTIGARLS